AQAWRDSGCLALMTVFRNRNRWGPSNAVCRAGRVVRFDKVTQSKEMEWIDYGLGGLAASAVSLVDEGVRDLAVLQTRLAELGGLSAYEVNERFYEIGSPESLAETDAYLRAMAPGGSTRP